MSSQCGCDRPIVDDDSCIKCGKPMVAIVPKPLPDRPERSSDSAQAIAKRKYRMDPEKRELERARGRAWKREHLGQPGRSKLAA